MDGRKLLELVEDGRWKGLPQWKCTLCPFDSVESKDVVIEHILTVHLAPPPAGPRGQALLVDARGNPLITAAPGVEVVVHEAEEEEADVPDDEEPTFEEETES